ASVTSTLAGAAVPAIRASLPLVAPDDPPTPRPLDVYDTPRPPMMPQGNGVRIETVGNFGNIDIRAQRGWIVLVILMILGALAGVGIAMQRSDGGSDPASAPAKPSK